MSDAKTLASDTSSARVSSPTRRISDSMHSIGNKISKVLTNSSEATEEPKDRSVSRGREVFVGSGRGGAGNIRAASRDPVTGLPVKHEIDDDTNATRGRELGVSPNVMSSGRGGAGNIRTPSKEPAPGDNRSKSRDAMDAYEREVLAKHRAKQEASGMQSSGRGGAGNMIRSPSREQRGGQPAQAPLPPPSASGATATLNNVDE